MSASPIVGRLDGSSWSAIALRVTLLLVGYVVLEWWCLRIGHLPSSSYQEPWLLPELGRMLLGIHPDVITSPLRVLVQRLLEVGMIVLAIRYRRELFVPWGRLEGGRSLRILVGAIAGILAWAFATYDVNLLAGQTHLADRLSLLALAALVVWRPAFVLPFVVGVVVMATQFHLPIGPYSTAEAYALLRMLMLVPVALALRAVTGRSWSRDLLFVAVLVLAESYLRCGIGKLALDWASHGHVYLLLFATYSNGWLGFLDADGVAALGRFVARFDWLMVGGTLILECGAFLAFRHRRILLVLLGGWILFHAGVATVSGIAFWKWAIVDAVLLGIFLSREGRDAFPLFSRTHFWLSLPVLAVGLVLFRPINLAWYDSPTSYTYRFVGVGESGREYALGPAYFAPFDYTFTLSSFHYLCHEPTLDITWGAAWDRTAVRQLLDAHDAADVRAVEEARGHVPFDADRTAHLDRFLSTFVDAYNRRGSKKTFLSPVAAPAQLWTFAREEVYPAEDPIRLVRVVQITTLFDGERYTECRERELHRVSIPTPSDDGA